MLLVAGLVLRTLGPFNVNNMLLTKPAYFRYTNMHDSLTTIKGYNTCNGASSLLSIFRRKIHIRVHLSL